MVCQKNQFYSKNICIKSNVLLLVIIGFMFQIYGQNVDGNKSDKLLDSYSEYFELPRETVFTHFNKTSFLVGESIWF